ncbi:MAG: class I SAM-dependent methyltransferase [Actinomycetota bacterium]
MIDSQDRAPMAKNWTYYDRMAAHLAPVARALATRIEVKPGVVIDIGSGSGNGLRAATAAGLTEAGVTVVGLDRSSEQLAAARPIGAPQVRGDALDLPFRPRSLAAATSNFGIIFAADHQRAFAQLADTLEPGGLLVFSAWEPDGWPEPARTALADQLDRRLPRFPTTLGERERATRLLTAAGFGRIVTEAGTLRWTFTDVDAAVEELSEAAGGLRMLRRQLEQEGRWPEARAELRTVLAPRCEGHGDGVAIVDRYLIHTAELV